MPPAPKKAWQASGTARDWLFTYFLRQKRLFLLGGLCLLGTNALALSIPWIIKDVIEAIRLHPATAGLAWHAGAIVAAAILACLVRSLSRTFLYAAGREVEFALRNDL